ncbi:hypothetical protein UZ36_01725 [Candidatus Nitromaritima sp. SCGC AAA799-C22]|nr:hypothetical protein UZ36_01725 [Candidatus Nitromaritima sp. SCGC AAA799-C22]
MLGETKTVPSLKSFDHSVGDWFKKWFHFPAKHRQRLDADYDQSDFYQLDLSDLEPIEATVALPDGITFQTVLHDLGASGFTCQMRRKMTVSRDQIVSILFVLPLEEPVLMEAKAIMSGQSLNGSPDTRLGRFRFTHGMDEEDRDLIHQFVLKKQIEIIRRDRKVETSAVE